MGKINLFNNHVFVFIAVLIITLLLVCFYNVILPEESVPFNFNPFPKQTPSKLPDPMRNTDSCWNKLTPCSSANDCSACSLGEYHCVAVTKEQAKNNYYHYNGINVPEGSWCLPKDNNPNPVCNMTTGRWVWSFDPAYCASIGSNSSQCWKCECLYPTLFSGAEEGCTTNTTCQNDSLMVKSLKQPGNKLVANSNAKASLQGCVWDPTTKTPDEKCQGLYDYTPYDKDKSGNPWFSCSCQDNSSSQYFTTLPGDPQTCHLEPCYKYLGNTQKGFSCSNDGQSCSCNCNNTNFAKSPGGKFAGTCVLIAGACGHYGWDADRGECACGNGPAWPRKCKSPTTGVNMEQKELPECSLPENALGSECYNPCEARKCNHNAPCISCGVDSVKGGVEECRMDGETGNVLSDPTKVHSVCDCSLADAPPPRPDGQTSHYGGYYGASCNLACLKDGTRLDSHVMGAFSPGSKSCSCCCSSRSKDEENFWIFSTDTRCDGSWPTPDKPADAKCLPVPTAQCPDEDV